MVGEPELAEIVDDRYPAAAASDRPALQQRLLDSFRRFLPNVPEIHQHLEELLCTGVSLGMLTDLAGYAMQIPIEAKTSLLEEADVDRRCEALLHMLEHAPRHGGAALGGLKWPPDFSAN